jgi:hypothetical protein
VALGVCDHPETRARNVLGRLNDAATELFCSCQYFLDVLDGDEEQDFVLSALARADGDKGAAFDAGVDKRVAREGAPSEATFQPNRSAKNRRVASGSWERISACTTG